MKTIAKPATVALTFAEPDLSQLSGIACGYCGKETLVVLNLSDDHPACCRRCFRARRTR